MDLVGIRREEVDRQNPIHELINSEYQYLRSHEILQYLYKHRSTLELGLAKKDGNFIGNIEELLDLFPASWS